MPPTALQTLGLGLKIIIITIIVFLLILFLTPFLFGPTRPPNYESPNSNESHLDGAKTAEELIAQGNEMLANTITKTL